MISRKEVSVPNPYQNYVNKAGDDNLIKALNLSTKRFRKVMKSIPKKKIDYAYAEGKWTIKQLLQHVIDAERVFVLRSLWFTRRDPSPQPGFDENIWADNAVVTNRRWKNMIDEFLSLRAANEFFFDSLSEDELARTGTASGNTVSTIAFGFVSAGHLQHHLDILEERYLAKPAKETKQPKQPKEPKTPKRQKQLKSQKRRKRKRRSKSNFLAKR
jgi:hypothetical protein